MILVWIWHGIYLGMICAGFIQVESATESFPFFFLPLTLCLTKTVTQPLSSPRGSRQGDNTEIKKNLHEEMIKCQKRDFGPSRMPELSDESESIQYKRNLGNRISQS